MPRTYAQFCPIAVSLDLLGDRWTLLLVRELVFGPRRFTDLDRALPGIGRNLLSQRLKDLQAAGVIEARELPPPAPASVYALTEYGEELIPVLDALFHWGQRLLKGEMYREYYLGVVPLMKVVSELGIRPGSGPADLTGEFHVDGEVFSVRIEGWQPLVTPGPANGADFIAAGDTKSVLALVLGYAPLDRLLDSGRIKVDADSLPALSAFLALIAP